MAGAAARPVLTNAPVALRMGPIKDLAAQLNTEVIPADATNMDDLNALPSIAAV